MAEGGDMSNTAQARQGPRAADMGDGALTPTAGAEECGGRPQPQCQFWVGRRTAVRIWWGDGGANQGWWCSCSPHTLWRHPEPWP